MQESTEQILDTIIKSGIEAKASDIHIDPTAECLKASFRIDGTILTYKEYPFELHESLMIRIKVLSRLPLDDKRLPKDGRFKWIDPQCGLSAEIRVSMMPTIFGENAVLRIFDPSMSILSFKELGFSDVQTSSIEQALSFSSGLIVVSGPTGSGKTTTLYSMLSYIKKSSRLIITIEDPVEKRIKGIRQIEVDGSSSLTYSSVLRSILRQDPDVIMLGEIRDKESALLALQAALTGHLVISTLHASSAFGIKNRLINMGVPRDILDATLILSLSQRLLGRICLECKEKIDSFYKGAGCIKCRFTGISGTMVASEILGQEPNLYDDGYLKVMKGMVPISEVLSLVNA